MTTPEPAPAAKQRARQLTSEQITQMVADMQSRLNSCSQSGTAYRVKWHEVKEIIATIQTLQDRLAEAGAFNNDVVEREAAACPEDVGFDEYIRALERELPAKDAEIERLKWERDSAKESEEAMLDGAMAASREIEISIATARADAIRECAKAVRDMGQQWYGEAKRRGSAFSDKGRIAEQIATELESLLTKEKKD
jgi:hypothetical protein